MDYTLKNIRNKSQQALNFDDLRQLPLALREYYAGKKGRFDRLYDNRKTDDYLQRFRSVKYPVLDRTYGSPNEDIANIYWNLFNEKETQELIDELIFERQWVYHPVRAFDKWHTLAGLYYRRQDLFWLLLVFNRITDPFTALQNFNIIRIPFIEFLYRLPYRITFDYVGVNL